MGIGDLFEERPRKVSPEAWVQHLLRYWSGQFVGGERGQRVLWAMVNNLLLSEVRSRGFQIYRNVMKRVGFDLQGGRDLTKRELRTAFTVGAVVLIASVAFVVLGNSLWRRGRSDSMYETFLWPLTVLATRLYTNKSVQRATFIVKSSTGRDGGGEAASRRLKDA